MTGAPVSTFSKGLEEVVATESSICSIDGKGLRLRYRGYDIHELVQRSSYDEVVYLLLRGELPTAVQLTELRRRLAAERPLPPAVSRFIETLPAGTNPMAVLRTVVSYMALQDPESESKAPDANERKALRLIARLPTVVAAYDRLRNGKRPVEAAADAETGTAACFLRMLKGAESRELEVKALDQYLVLLAEHDLNASTFAARTTASTTSDIYSAVTSAIGALKGDLHGSANTRSMEMILEVGSPEKAEAYVTSALDRKEKLMGFGHRVYKGQDPRADDLRRMAKDLIREVPEQAKWYAISEAIERAVKEKKNLSCNVDFYSASVLYSIGIPVDLFTPMFAVSRIAGWTAHILEQYANNRLLRPVSAYLGPSPRAYVPIQNR
ncbi:MAG: Citrate synthase 2 [Candidatus Omnitrophica bacterium]|nr:Citrate synthase 2 [Candidatus Omnitrophota bacterium]